MKNKTPLSLMEQLIMLLVFAFAAALCLQVFVLSNQMSRRCEATDHAVTMIQNTAEVLKASGGDFSKCATVLGGTVEDNNWQIWYDENWNETAMDQAIYQLTISLLPSDLPTLGSAEICAMIMPEDPLSAITVSWQEVIGE